MKARRWWPDRRQAIAAFAVALALLLLNDTLLFESVLVPTASMAPTILPNERLIVSHVPLSAPRRGDVVVFSQGGQRLIKRVVGLPGEHVRVLGPFSVEVNGTLLPPPPGTTVPPAIAGVEGEVRTFVLGPEAYFLMGDNRLDSADSRAFGPVAKASIQGKAIAIWYSFDRHEHRIRSERIGILPK